ncbi:MAG: hypothetical protein GKR90_06290 [Pseudomonadales bacterium]|nr:hypothetical protein [Pseudomonadales bacterium]
MSTQSSLVVLVLVVFITFPLLSVAGGHGVPAMADVVMKLQHFPNDDQKAALAKIADDSSYSVAEQQVATAIANMQHKVSAEDSERLAAIAANESLHKSLRALAKVVIGINHMPSAEDKETLAKLSAAH